MKKWRVTTLQYPDVLETRAFISANKVEKDTDPDRGTTVIADGVAIDFMEHIYEVIEFVQGQKE